MEASGSSLPGLGGRYSFLGANGSGLRLGLSDLLGRTHLFDVGNQDSGGYDCEFVTPPPDTVQRECPACLRIPKEPCIISCPCGKEFCQECIEGIKKDNKPCPLCNKSDFNFMRFYGSEIYLMAQEVWCSHKKDGCEWKGKLQEYEHHRNPPPDSQVIGCQFAFVECKYKCGERLRHHMITNHQNNECTERPYSCEYCKYESTFKRVTEIHYELCKKYPVTCSNECQKDPFKRENIDNHLKNECPLAQINCPLQNAGCEVKLPRKDMPEHLKDTATHLTLLANFTQRLQTENQELQKLNKTLEEKQKATEKHVDNLLTVTVALLRDTKELKLTSRFPIDFRINYPEKDVIELPSFSTHSNGYQMLIRVYTNGRLCKGTHVSIFTCFRQGSNDNHLKWPFRGEITIGIVNQAEDKKHFQKTILYNNAFSDICARRLAGTGREIWEWGHSDFIAHSELDYNAEKKTQYLKDGIIIVRVVRVKIT